MLVLNAGMRPSSVLSTCAEPRGKPKRQVQPRMLLLFSRALMVGMEFAFYSVGEDVISDSLPSRSKQMPRCNYLNILPAVVGTVALS